jgi:hypothetical protein
MNRILKAAYIAGVIDSDGWFTIHRNVKQGVKPIYSPRMGINQAEMPAVELARSMFGGSLKVVDHQSRHGHGKPLHCWVIGSDGLIEAVEELLPHLRLKWAHALCVLMLQKNIREYKKAFRAVRGGVGRSVYPDAVYEEREDYYKALRMLHSSTATETERQGVEAVLAKIYEHERRDDATVRTRRMENVVEA